MLPMNSAPSSGLDTAAPTAPAGKPITSGSVNSNGELEYDHTIRVKTPASGAMFFNRYRLTRVLGRGGMGVVWLADDLKLERPVALKFLPSLLGLDESAIKELKTETRRGLELSHPNIVRIYDFVDDEEVAAISMEFVDGRTLSELRMGTEHGVFTVDQIVQWLPGVCAALDYAHFHRKLVHRDLKPANIMSTSKDHIAKVADFGIARSLSDTMSRLSAAQLGASGTLPYMSPQQAMGERPMPTDDVYSLGATIYELLSGKPPFYRGDISTQITSKIPSSMLERREELEIRAIDSIPKEWEAAIALCLHKDADMRPQSAGALAEMLGLHVSHTSGATRTVVHTRPAPASVSGKSKTPLYAAAAVVAVLAGAAIYHFNATPAAKAEVAAVTPPAAPAPAAPAAPVAGQETMAAALPATPAPPPAEAAAAPAPAAPEPVPAPPPTVAAAAPATPGTIPLEMPAPVASPVPAGMIQPPVTEPPGGHWPLAMLFPTPPHAAYSENGRRHLLYEAQSLLRDKQLYSSTQDGKEGKGTHNAIVLFQAKSGLVPNGLLDGPTLAAMELGDLPDDPGWKPPAVASSSSGSRRRSQPKDEPNLLQRAGKSIGKLFKRD